MEFVWYVTPEESDKSLGNAGTLMYSLLSNFVRNFLCSTYLKLGTKLHYILNLRSLGNVILYVNYTYYSITQGCGVG
jgi:hypothetical protein